MKAIGFILAAIIAYIICFIGAVTAVLSIGNIQATLFTAILACIVCTFGAIFGLITGEKFYKWFESKLK